VLISSARNLTRLFARNAGDQTFYPAIMVDVAIQAAADELISRASLLPRTDSLSITVGQAAFPVALANFRPDRLRDAFLSGDNVQVNFGAPRWNSWQYVEGGPAGAQSAPDSATLDVVDFASILDHQIANGAQSQPVAIAFRDWNTSTATAATYPIPDQTYTLNLRWSDFLTQWNAGSPLVLSTIGGGAVTGVEVTDGLINDGLTKYLSAPAIVIQGGGGTGATATSTIDGNGALASITVTAGGTGYTTTPDVLVNGVVSTDLTLNLPDDLFRNVLLYGAPAFLQHNDPEHAYATESGQKFEAYIQSKIGSAGGLGVASVMPRRRRR
jgi:hypothetical protein